MWRLVNQFVCIQCFGNEVERMNLGCKCTCECTVGERSQLPSRYALCSPVTAVGALCLNVLVALKLRFEL